jgi:predicted ThiF/HesA family dinucleotide-utilizing enzyme
MLFRIPDGGKMSMEEVENLENLERKKVPYGEVTLVGLGRLGLRTGLNLIEVHRGGPEKINAIDGQKISADDLVFRMLGAETGEYKVDFFKKFADGNSSKKVEAISRNISGDDLDLIKGDVVCIEIAGGDTLPVTAEIIKKAHETGISTISTMGVFGLGHEEIKVVDISEGDPGNPIVSCLMEYGINENHLLIGTGKLIRDWEPVTPAILDRTSAIMATEILKILKDRG